MSPALSVLWGVCLSAAAGQNPQGGPVEYLADTQHRWLYFQQGWGELGINVSAHAAGQPGLPLQIGGRKYERGLGHHAPGEIVVDLGGEYERFEAEVGLQPLPGGMGSVVFKVFVDDKPVFDSGIIRADTPAKPLSVPLAGASELRLVVTDAGDGITCDCANWAEARLVRAATPTALPADALLDAAPFAQVITCDPNRTDGARATRVQEFRAEDLFLETPLLRDDRGAYIVPAPEGKPACIGLKWIERRCIRELGLDCADAARRPSPEGVQVQCWVGESLWQGGWEPLAGKLEASGTSWKYAVDWSKTPQARGGTRKIRWIFPPSAPADRQVAIRRLTALTPGPLETVDLRLECPQPRPGTTATIAIYNGQFVDAGGMSSEAPVIWDLGRTRDLKVRHTRPRPWKADKTVLRFRLPDHAFGVGVDDVLANGGVYVKQSSVYVGRQGGPTVAQYLEQIKGRKTILEQVRESPDQTFEQALAVVHSDAQDLAPTMLSLACDNHKFVVHRDGTIQFALQPDTARVAMSGAKYPAQIAPTFGSGKPTKISRHLFEDGWLPAPVTVVEDSGIEYQQTTCVIPSGGIPTSQPVWLAPRAMCVAQFTMRNTTTATARASAALRFTLDSEKHQLAQVRKQADNAYVAERGGSADGGPNLLAWIQTLGDSHAEATDGGVRISADVPAGGQAAFAVYVPAWDVAAAQFSPPTDFHLSDYWHAVLADTMQIELPDKRLETIIRASQVHCLIAARNEEDGRRIAPWVASVAYGPLESEGNSVIRAMDVFGHEEFCRRAFDFYFPQYNPAGYLTTGYTLMGTGWHLWMLGEHYRLYRDADWLRGAAPKVATMCNWICRQLQKTRRFDAGGHRVPEYGLMPPGVMADWDAFAYYFCLNGYYYAGLRGAAEALADIGYPGADVWLRNAAAFREDVLRAYRWTQAQMPVYRLRDGTSVLGYPSSVYGPGPTNNFFPGEDGNRSWCYDVELGAHQLVPQGVLDANSQDVADMMDHMEDVQFLADGWFDYPAERNQKDPFNLGGFSKVQPYYCRNGEIYALRDDVKPFIRSYFNTVSSLLNRENLSLQEHFHGAGAWNKTHETGYFLLHTRLMLVQERGDELWLAPFVTSNWLKDGMSIGVKRAPTYFGPVSYRITSHVSRGTVEVSIDQPARSAGGGPKAIVVRLRHPESKPLAAATLTQGAGAVTVQSDSVRIESPTSKLLMRARFGE